MNHFINTYGFSGIPTFLRSRNLRSEKEVAETDFDIAVVGVPFDEGCPFVAGQRKAPRTLREHSLRFSSNGIYDFDTDRALLSYELQNDRIVDLGDADIIPTDITGNIRRTTELARLAVQKKALLIGLGGDHSVTNPLVQAFDVLGENIHVIHFDSHPDFRDTRPGFEYTNGHPFMHVHRMKHVTGITQVGIRSNRTFSVNEARQAGIRVIGMTEFHKIGPGGVADSIPQNTFCYVSIDIDALDCSLVPGCVSAEPNGFMFQELIDTLVLIAQRNEVVGFDLVEIAPDLDVGTGITSYIGTQIITRFLGAICDQPRWVSTRHVAER